jgi:hypothetical protein
MFFRSLSLSLSLSGFSVAFAGIILLQFIVHSLQIVPYKINKSYYWNYWVFGLFPSPGILETRKYGVSETGFVSVLR